jgi:single-stranded-DNA-specific exonuclease
VNILGKADLVSIISKYKSVRIIPDTSLDSLLASSILLKTLREQGISAKVTLDAKVLIDERDTPAILINLPPLNQSQHVSISYRQDYSATGFIASFLDDLYVIEWWDKILSIIAALYRDLYVFKEGKFKGLEDKILRELINDRRLEEATIPRAWGIKRLGIVESIKRTLIPFLPGFTGNSEKIQELASRIFKKNPEQIRNLDKLDEEMLSQLLEFLNNIAKTLGMTIEDFTNKLLGDFIIPSEVFNGLEIQLSEAMGSLLVFNSLYRDSPIYMLEISLDMSVIPVILSIYESSIDEAASMLGIIIPEWLTKKNTYIDVEEYFKRPGIVIDILNSLSALPAKKPVTILYNGQKITELRELLRVGIKPEEAYTLCDEVQLCVVK